MLLGISLASLLILFIAAQVSGSGSSLSSDTTSTALRNTLLLPLKQIHDALEPLQQMRDDLASLASQSSHDGSHLTGIGEYLNDHYRLGLKEIRTKWKKLNPINCEEIFDRCYQTKCSLCRYLATVTKPIALYIGNKGCPTGDTVLAKDCSQLYGAGYTASGVYTVYIRYAGQAIPISVFCDMETDGGGWFVFQRRKDGSVNFYRRWTSYTDGFGNITGEFWLGNAFLHLLTDQKPQQLRVDLHDHEGHTAYAMYNHFYVSPQTAKFALNISGYSGTAGDSMSYNNKKKFSTKDQDNDKKASMCATERRGA